MKHTPEPWTAETDPLHFDSLSVITAGEEETRSGARKVRRLIVHVGGFANITEQEANTRRIAACVNACAGISTKTLECEETLDETFRRACGEYQTRIAELKNVIERVKQFDIENMTLDLPLDIRAEMQRVLDDEGA